MKPNYLLLLLLCVFLPACASITPLQSTPPYSKIAVNRPFSWGDGILTVRVDMPTGTYTPLYEDKGGYYYQAPQKITGRDTGMPLLLDGGLYLERNVSKPEKIYIIRSSYGVPLKIRIGDRADVSMTR
jgi:hypothetical protein